MLVDDTTFSSVVAALGDPLSTTLLTRESALNSQYTPADLSRYERPAEWSTLHASGRPWAQATGGTTMAAGGSSPSSIPTQRPRTPMPMSFYSACRGTIPPSRNSPRGAWVQNPIDLLCIRLTAEVQKSAEGSTLSIHCTMGEDGPTALTLMDMGFLLP